MCYHDIKPYAHSLTSGTMLICEISVYYMLTDHKSDRSISNWIFLIALRDQLIIYSFTLKSFERDFAIGRN